MSSQRDMSSQRNQQRVRASFGGRGRATNDNPTRLIAGGDGEHSRDAAPSQASEVRGRRWQEAEFVDLPDAHPVPPSTTFAGAKAIDATTPRDRFAIARKFDPANIAVYAMFAMMVVALVSLAVVTLYLIKSMLGIDLMPGESPLHIILDVIQGG